MIALDTKGRDLIRQKKGGINKMIKGTKEIFYPFHKLLGVNFGYHYLK